ncbi:hypothetical protein Tcan_04571 [Toxocara canis]|nr:hypothetical protein Tcan_04571 [Toxocara canis]
MCTCDEVRPCKDNAINSVIPCSDRCQKHAEEAGANYVMLRDCILEYRPQIVQAIECVTQELSNTCSAGPTDMQVPKRYAIGMELAFVEEISSMLTAVGVHDQVVQFIAIGRKFGHCLQDCIERETNRCADADGCELNLPSDNQIVQVVKNCAIRSGVFTTSVVQSLCECAVRSGVSSLNDICPRLVVQ